MTDLLAKLREAGAVEAKGRFTLDSDKAREKLRQYQLADPHRYVLLLVEAMVLAGARKLEFQIDADDVRLRCFCRPFRHEQLDDLYASLFVELDASLDERERAHLRGLQQLAFALNSAMALNPRFIRVESIDADGQGVVLVLEPERPDRLERITGCEPGTRVHVRDRFRPGLLVEFFRSVGGNVAEQQLLRKHCRWSPATIELDGRVISGPLEFDGEYWFAEPVVDNERTIGRAAIHLVPTPGSGQLGPAHVELLCNGVWVERVELERMITGFAAIIDDDQLRRDVSQNQILRDAAFERVLAALRQSEAKLVARLADRWVAETDREHSTIPVWTESTLREWLSLQSSVLSSRMAQDPRFAAVAKVPLWRAIGGARLTTADLLDHDPIYYSHLPFEFAPSEVPFVVELFDDEERRLFDGLFGRRGVDHAPALRREQDRDRQRKLFLTRNHPTQLAEGYYLRREPVKGWLGPDRPITGELGLRSLGHRDSWVRLIREGCLLQEVRLAHPIPGLCAVIEAEFTPNDDWDAARPDERLAEVAFELLRALERMLRALAESGVVEHDTFELQELLRAYVRAICDRRFVTEFLEQFGFEEAEVRTLLRKLQPAGIAPEWKLDPAADEPLHPIARVPLYVQAQGRTLALAELREWLREGKRIAWLDHDIGPLPQLDRPVLLLDMAERSALRALFGEQAFERYHDRLTWLRQREAFLAQPTQTLEHGKPALATTALRDPRLRGELALCEFVARTDTIFATAVARIRVFHQQRPLCEVDLELPLPGLIAWVDSDQLEVSGEFRQLARVQDLRPALLAAIPEVVRIELERARREPKDLRRCELWFVQRAIALVLGDESMLRAYLELRAAKLASEIAGVLALLERWPARELERALGRVRGRSELATRAEVERELGRPSRSPNGTELELAAVRIGLAAFLDELLAVPLLRAMEGTRVGVLPVVAFAELFESIAAKQAIGWVPEGFRIDRMPQGAGRVLVLDPIERRICTGMVGADALEDVSEWLTGRAHFERRKRVDEIRLPRGQALVQIAIAEQGVRGELGLVRESTAMAGRSRIRVFHLGREIIGLDLPAEPLTVIGALEFDTLELSAAHDDLTAAGRERVRSEVARHGDALLNLLIERYPELTGAERSLAAELLRRVLVTWPPGSGGYAARAKRNPKRFARLADLPVFPGARRPWTASELAEAAQRSAIATIDSRVDRRLPEGPVIVLERADLLPTLDALFGRTRDLAAEWARQDELERIKAAAPRLPEQPLNAIGSIEVSGEALTGRLWWAPGIDYEIALGREGRAFATRAAPAVFPCAGALGGPGLTMNSNWTRANPNRAHDRLIEQGAYELWMAMIGEFEQLEAEPKAATEWRRVGLREALRGQFLRLHAAGASKRVGGKKGKKDRKARTGEGARNKTEAMVRRLWTLKLLRLAAGHHVSPEVAVRERPVELASLELWQGPSAEELAQRAAAERKQAEQRRLAELDARREEERERRRAEQEAAREAAQERRRREQIERERAERERAERERAEREAKPKTKSKSKSKPEPVVPRRTPEQQLLDAVCNELRLVRGKCEGLLGNHHLESLVPVLGGRGPLFEQRAGTGEIGVNVDHPLVQAALQAALDDPARVTLLASAAYTFLNLAHPEITDEDEAEFLRLHAAHAASLE
jgi:hypothetical protein